MRPEDINLSGFAVINEDLFSFCPDNPVPTQTVRYKKHGTGMQSSDGTFEFVAIKAKRAKSQLVRKLAHGRVSITADGAVQTTIKIFNSECIDVANAIVQEALDAADAIRDYLHAQDVDHLFQKLP